MAWIAMVVRIGNELERICVNLGEVETVSIKPVEPAELVESHPASRVELVLRSGTELRGRLVPFRCRTFSGSPFRVGPVWCLPDEEFLVELQDA